MNKKMNKKITNILLAVIVALSAAMPSFAQDARQRKVETIVQDVLAQMPVQDKADLDREMEDLAKSAPQSVQMRSTQGSRCHGTPVPAVATEAPRRGDST